MSSDRHTYAIDFGGHQFILDAQSALFWPTKKILVMSDLHLEKGSFLASHGNPLPLYDTYDTLIRIKQLIKQYQPDLCLSLGDNLHDGRALNRMQENDRELLYDIIKEGKSWCWVLGNHDPLCHFLPNLANIEYHESLLIDNIVFSHDIIKNAAYQIIGHYHPKISIKTSLGSVAGKCFAVGKEKLLMPAFGSYTGGLSINHPVIQKIQEADKFNYFLLYNHKIWAAA